MNPTLVPALVGAVTFVVGTGIQIATYAFFMGKMKGAQEALSEQLTRVANELTTFQAAMQALQTHRAELDVRMAEVQRNAAGVSGLTQKLERHLGSYDAEKAETGRRLDKLERGQDGVNRQLANMMKARTTPIHAGE